MKSKNYSLLSAVLLTIGWLFAPTGVKADLFTPVSGDLPRTCNLGGTKVTIIAGPDAFGNLADEFPRLVTCPSLDCGSFAGPGQFKLWEYKFIFNVPASNAYLSVSADTTVSSAYTSPSTPPPAISPFCSGFDTSESENDGPFPCETRIFKFTAPSSTFKVAYITPPEWSPRIATAGAKGSNASHLDATCLLAGAGKPTEATGNAVTHVESQTPACDYEFEVGPSGRSIVTGTLKTIPPNNPDCPIEETNVPPSLNGMEVSGFETDLDRPVRSLGSCNYSYTNTSGGLSTITCSTCCIQKSTNKCVLKSSLTNVSTQCKSGTF